MDVAAPGLSIFSTFPNHSYALATFDSYGYASETSMAAPHVAGLAALVWATPYGTSNVSVRNRIGSTCDAISGTGPYWIHGRINACNAVGGSGYYYYDWDTTGYTPATTHTLRARATDNAAQSSESALVTVTVVAGTMHVASVQILDKVSNPAANASVVGDWLLIVSTAGDKVEFCVTNVTHALLIYDESDNVETCGSRVMQ